ncbi:MAG: bifunctional diguanylate cyclase/phosphodiesterase [Actinomycetes bacterium]
MRLRLARQSVVATLAIVMVAFLATVTGWLGSGQPTVTTIATPMAWGFAMIAWVLAVGADRRYRAGRIVLGIALAAVMLGQIATVSFATASGALPAWGWVDVPWLGAYPVLVVGLVMLNVEGGGLSRIRVVLDSLLVALGTLSAVAYLLDFVGASEFASVNPDAFAASWPYLVADAAVVGLMISLANGRGWRQTAPEMYWLFAVVVTLGALDVLYYLIDGSGRTDLWAVQDAAELLPPMLVALAVVRQLKCAGEGSRRIVVRQEKVLAQSAGVLPLLAVAVALGVLVATNLQADGSGDLKGKLSVVFGLAFATVLFVLLRLGLAYRDSRALALSRIEADTDELTGLPNRNGLLSGPWSDLTLLQAPADPGQGRVVLVLRLDRFDAIEDALGQDVGEALLVEVAARLQAVVPAPTVLARVLGAQFAVVYDDVAGGDGEQVARSLVAALDEPVSVAGVSMRLPVVVGLAWHPYPFPSMAEHVRHADIAKNCALRGHRKLGSFRPDMDDAAASLHLSVELERALREDLGLSLHYQPIVDLQTLAPVGVEALIRWTTPEGRRVAPGEFLPLVSAAGLSYDLDEWVLRQAVRQMAQWHGDGLPIPVSVNMGSDSVRPNLPDRIGRAISEAGVAADLLTVELIEDPALGDAIGVQEVFQRLRGGGVKVAIDDFGTGWSALSYLHRLDVDVLKIDRSFVLVMAEDAAARSIVASTVSMARALGLVVVAEGVETDRELRLLRDVGCHRGQGFGIARPMPALDVAQWWSEYSGTDEMGAATVTA